ncbi:hypothetical protein VIGAN_04180000 [Vigna angularis var. angularis]|uniref:Uncharacterized protein n=1 Tax=Vigna angularis var. angularis TaxID=157739 RepID=A0A0S3RV05_PHAAN|nr:hypothetical protein VIGAN_04180000 [Vigna angularis var. angularis]
MFPPSNCAQNPYFPKSLPHFLSGDPKPLQNTNFSIHSLLQHVSQPKRIIIDIIEFKYISKQFTYITIQFHSHSTQHMQLSLSKSKHNINSPAAQHSTYSSCNQLKKHSSSPYLETSLLSSKTRSSSTPHANNLDSTLQPAMR